MDGSNKIKLFLSVGNVHQKNLCQKILMLFQNSLPCSVTVVSDDDLGGRIGSGGAVLSILKKHYRPGTGMIILNAGGFSKRALLYSIRTKVFADFMQNGSETTLFEQIVDRVCRLMRDVNKGVLVCCGDILLDFDGAVIPPDGNMGFCVGADAETASRHGVMFADKSGRLLKYMHKVPVAALSECAGQQSGQGFSLDTGYVYFCEETVSRILQAEENCQALKRIQKNRLALNLYTDIIPLLSKNIDTAEYERTDTEGEEHLLIKRSFYRFLHNDSLEVKTFSNQKLIHFGTVREVRNLILSGADSRDTVAINSVTGPSCSIGRGTVLDNALLSNKCIIGENCVVADISLSGCVIPDNTLVYGLVLRDGSYVTVICPVDENPKLSIDGQELWRRERFYKGCSFNDSLQKYINNVPDEKFSLAYCTENARYEHYIEHRTYLKERRDSRRTVKIDAMRENILNTPGYKSEPLPDFRCALPDCTVNLPVRINFSGTWTDAMPYCVENGGDVINAAITVDGEMPIFVKVEKLRNGKIELCNDGVTVDYQKILTESNEEYSGFKLHDAALKALGFTDNTVLHDGLRLTTCVKNIESGSGLGVSSILLAGCFMALSRLMGREISENKIVQMVFWAEQYMGTGGGWQDQIGGLFPGIKRSRSEPGLLQAPRISKLAVSEAFCRKLSDRLFLVPTGQRHFGRFIVENVAMQYFQKEPEAVEAFSQIRELNNKAEKAIVEENIESFAAVLREHTALLQKLSPMIINEQILNVMQACEPYVSAISVLGAGGGGYLLALLKEDVDKKEFKAAFKEEMPLIQSKVKSIKIFG